MADRYATQNLNTTLTGFAAESMAKGGPGVADLLAPVVRVPTTSFKYYLFQNTEKALSNDMDQERAPKGTSVEVSRSYSSATDSCRQYGVRELVADEEQDNADKSVINPLNDATLLVQGKISQAREARINAALFSTGNITRNAGATAAWNAASGVDIEADVDAAKLSVWQYSGQKANTIVIPPLIAVAAKKDSNIRDLVKYTDSRLLVNGDLPPKLFGLDVVIPGMLNNEANPGISTASFDFLYDDTSVLVAYIERGAPSKKSQSLAYTFRRPIMGQEMPIYTYRDEGRHGTWVDGLLEEVVKIVDADCGYLITTAYS